MYCAMYLSTLYWSISESNLHYIFLLVLHRQSVYLVFVRRWIATLPVALRN